jgi:hypothetical protein
MKLNDEQVAQVFDQTGADPVPENHQAITELRSVFGDHTFYVAPDGLCVWEPMGHSDTGGQVAEAMVVASWADEEKTELQPHDPKPTAIMVKLDERAGAD